MRYSKLHKKCLCGCDGYTNIGKKFIWGHNKNTGVKGRIAWNKGLKFSKEWCKKISDRARSRYKDPVFAAKMYSILHSPETRLKRGNSLIGNTNGQGHTPWNKGKKCSEEFCEKISKRFAGKKLSKAHATKIHEAWEKLKFTPKWDAWREKLRLSHAGKKLSKEHIEKLIITHRGQLAWNKGLTKETNEGMKKISKAQKKLWRDPEYVKKVKKAMGVKPNKLELKFENFLNNLYPNEWKYVGDGQLIIGGKCPDFVNINGQKKIIELFGDYWHRGEDPKDRAKAFKPFGYETLVIWESELKRKPNLSELRIRRFING